MSPDWLLSFVPPPLKNDKFRRIRGGKAVLLTVYCSSCSFPVLVYQKDGDGELLRCYLNRIVGPPSFANLQDTVERLSLLQNLACPCCQTVLGSPMVHSDGRLAFRLKRGKVRKRRGVDRQPDPSIGHRKPN